jgi:phosphohistidine swiveling domain-containing protein
MSLLLKEFPETLVQKSAGEIGGKAAGLSELQAAGFRVPPFVVSPLDIRATIEQLGTPLIVRSSATAEDGVSTSFAGQFRSFLNLNTQEEVEHAIALCHEALNEPTVSEYARKHGIAQGALRMEVIVQRMIQPELAGVAFTVNPVDGTEEVVIEAVAGLADDLLCGRTSALAADDPLVQRHRCAIDNVARQIQRHFGAPQDIEFAIESGELWIVQTRPITRIGFAQEVDQWTNADFRDGGVSCTVCTPLMWSLYEFIWSRALKDSLRELKLFKRDFVAGRMFFGRPYWNLGALKECLAALPGFDEREFERDLGVQSQAEQSGHLTPLNFSSLIGAIPIVLAVRRFLRQQLLVAERLLHEPWRELESTSLRELIETHYFRIESTYFRTIFAASLAKTDFCSSFPDAEYGLLTAAIPPLSHMAPIRQVQALDVRSPQNLSRIIETYSHHYRIGLDILFPRWGEDREFVTQMLSEVAECGGSDPRPAYEAARSATLASLPFWKRRSFVHKLDRLRHFLWLREELRDVSNRMYSLIRKRVLLIAEERGLGDSIFFQTYQEILLDVRERIDRNRAIFESYRNFAAPNEIGSRFRFDSRPSSGEMQGIGASPGTVTAPAFVARTVHEAVRMPRGQILVCPCTDPGWTAILDRVAGVVTETGGLLSHAAILCREYGIPAVLGIKDATKRIAHQSVIKICGGDGHVESIP